MQIYTEVYHTIYKGAFAEYKDRGSKFIGYSFPLQDVEDFKKKLAELKKEHGKATHHCFAYRLGLDGQQFRSSDDGEPSGTAGRPILAQIDSKCLTDVLVVVVRYFGGTLLGVPGLIQAYKTTASLVLQLSPIIEKPVEVLFTLGFDYTRLGDIMTIVKRTQTRVILQETQLFCRMTIGIPKSRLQETLHYLGEIRGMDITPL